MEVRDVPGAHDGDLGRPGGSAERRVLARCGRLGAPGGSVGGGHGVGEGGRGRGGGSHGDLIDRSGGGAQSPLGDRWNFVRPDSRRLGFTSPRRGVDPMGTPPSGPAPGCCRCSGPHFSCPEGRSSVLGRLAEGAASQDTDPPAGPSAAGTHRSWRDGGRGGGASLLARGAAAFDATGRGREEKARSEGPRSGSVRPVEALRGREQGLPTPPDARLRSPPRRKRARVVDPRVPLPYFLASNPRPDGSSPRG